MDCFKLSRLILGLIAIPLLCGCMMGFEQPADEVEFLSDLSIVDNGGGNTDAVGGDSEPNQGGAIPIPNPAPQPIIKYSYSADLQSPQVLDGAVLNAQELHIFVENGSAYTQVEFQCCKRITGPSAGEPHHRIEQLSAAPFRILEKLAALDSGGERELSIKASYTAADGSVQFITSTVHFTIQERTTLRWTYNKDRSNSSVLYDETVSGKIYVIVESPRNIFSVAFYLDNPTRSGNALRIEGQAPWDMYGAEADGSATPLDTATKPNGLHSITVRVQYDDGSAEIINGNIEFAN